MHKYKDMYAASSSTLGKLIEEKAHPSVIEVAYQRANAQFKKDYPTCTDEWFKRMNNGSTSKTSQGLPD